MKTAAQFDTFVGHSHAVNTKVELHAPDGTLVGDLPVEAGSVTGDATRRVSRWAGDLTLAGLDWAPDGIGHPLSGLTGHYCTIQRSGYMYGGSEQWVEVARLWVYATEVEMSRQGGTLRVQLASPADLMGRAVGKDDAANNETCQAMIIRLCGKYLPDGFTLTTLDSSPPVAVPRDYEARWDPVVSVIDTLAALADARVYFDALGRLVIRPTLPGLDATLPAGRDLSVDVDVIRYTLTFGRDIVSNDVRARYSWEDGNGDQKEVDGTAAITAGPLKKDATAGRLSTLLRFDQHVGQAEADAYAASVLTSQSQAWVTSRIEAVQDPRIEPDDVVETRYLDRTLRHRVVGVSFDLTTDQMQITGRTALGSP